MGRDGELGRAVWGYDALRGAARQQGAADRGVAQWGGAARRGGACSGRDQTRLGGALRRSGNTHSESAELASRLPRRRLHAEEEDVQCAVRLPSSRLDRLHRQCRRAEEPRASETKAGNIMIYSIHTSLLQQVMLNQSAHNLWRFCAGKRALISCVTIS